MRDIKCKKCNNLKEGWCVRVLDNPDPDMVRTCSHFWEKTNGDMIRAMTDEDLADKVTCLGCPESQEIISCSKFGSCRDCWLEWLRQPCEGGKS